MTLHWSLNSFIAILKACCKSRSSDSLRNKKRFKNVQWFLPVLWWSSRGSYRIVYLALCRRFIMGKSLAHNYNKSINKWVGHYNKRSNKNMACLCGRGFYMTDRNLLNVTSRFNYAGGQLKYISKTIIALYNAVNIQDYYYTFSSRVPCNSKLT